MSTNNINNEIIQAASMKNSNKFKRTRKKLDKSAVNMSSSDEDEASKPANWTKSKTSKPKTKEKLIKLDQTMNKSDPVVLFKYNKMNDDLNLNLIKAKQLQKKREMRSVLLFVFFLFITILTLSQILVMHSQKNNSNFSQIKLMQEELKLMDYSIDKMLKENYVLPMQIWYSLKQYNDNLKKFSNLIEGLNYFNNPINTSNFSENILSTNDLILELINCNSTESSLIFTSLISLLNETSKITDNETKTSRNLQYDKLEVLLKAYLKNSSVSDDECIQTVLFGFYYLFNEQFSRFFEKNALLRQILSDRSDIVSKTLASFIKTNQSYEYKNISNEYILKSPLRNLDLIYKRYKQVKSKSRFFNASFKLCDAQPPILYGPLNITEKKYSKLMLNILERENNEVRMGGSWSPKNCQARHKIAIIIPYRDRLDHLVTLLSYLHPILQRQQLDYKIYVTEQSGNGTFNKAIIMNAAFIYAFDQDNYDCYCFHDVDLVPEDDRNTYSCGRNPKHMSIGVDEMNYKLQYEELIGGVLILKTEHLIASNGYSNLYWGWGAEDDDLYYRLKGLGYKIERPPLKIGRYRMMKHMKRKPQLWSKRAKLLYSSVNRMTWDGISSANYTLLKTTVHKLYTHLLIDVGVPPAGFN